jgi:inorganic pyrophosphatase
LRQEEEEKSKIMKPLQISNLFIALCICSSCGFLDDYQIKSNTHFLHGYPTRPTYKTQVNAIILTPAGDRELWELNKLTGSLNKTFVSGASRTIDFLPAIGNHGVIPQTEDAHGNPLAIFIISGPMKRGQVMKVSPISTIGIIENGIHKNIVIALSSKSFYKDTENYRELKLNYPVILELVEKYLINYKHPMRLTSLGFIDTKATHKLINSTHKTYQIGRLK